MSRLPPVPDLGTIVPIMGSQPLRSSLAGALFSTTRQRVLGVLFGRPGRSFYAREIIALAGAGGSGAVQRELERLERSGLVLIERRGSQKHFQANPDSPLFDELCSIARKTFALAEPLKEALLPLAPRIRAAFVYGSVARHEDTARSDIDLMIVSDDLDFTTVVMALHPTESKIGRPINPNILGSEEFARNRRTNDTFLNRVLHLPRLWILGSEDDLPS